MWLGVVFVIVEEEIKCVVLMIKVIREVYFDFLLLIDIYKIEVV